MDPRRSSKGFPPLTSINGTGCRQPPQTRKGEEDKKPLTPSAPQGPNTRTSNGNNIFFHSAQGQATTATAADAAMLRRTMTPSSSSSSRATEEGTLLFCLFPALTMVVQQVRHVVHLTMVVQQVRHVVHLTMVA